MWSFCLVKGDLNTIYELWSSNASQKLLLNARIDAIGITTKTQISWQLENF